MEYISAKEFLKQPVEVQKVFIDWWAPSEGDLIYYTLAEDLFMNETDNSICISTINEEGYLYLKSICKEDCIPLLTEGQLRKFIEDKTGGKVILTYNLLNNILIKVIKENDIHNNNLETICRYPIDSKSNVLNAYWKVACEIAKQSN